MKFIIIASKKDKAGINIVQELKNLNPKIASSIYLTDKELIYADNIDKENEIKNCDFIIFASKHSAKEHSKTLTLHNIGNFQQAQHGGKSKNLCPTNPLVSKHFFQILNKINENNKSQYQVTLEATHHGPYIEKPSLFIEVGSSPLEWEDKFACNLIAKTILESISTFKEQTINLAIGIGIGGPHYCPNFNKTELEDKFALSFIAAKYNFPLEQNNIEEMIKKTHGKVKYAIIDWKGCGNSSSRNEILEMLKKFNLEIIKA